MPPLRRPARIAAVLLLSTVPVGAFAQEAGPDRPASTFDERVARQPKDVRTLVDRITGCDHWAGEEPYDADRRRQIESALRDLKCNRIDRDAAKLRLRYWGNSEVVNLIDEARNGIAEGS